MATSTIFFFAIPVITSLLLVINLLFAKHTPYLEKDSPFECGYHSFTGQSRAPFNITFFTFGLLFLLFDLELTLTVPYAVTTSFNEGYGLLLFIVFFLVITLGFAFEIGKGALSISSRQTDNTEFKNSNVSKKTYLNK
jgi:NADH-ubiquinone oxidoreductase chain 3